MKKIGILLKSTTCDKYLYETVSDLFNSGRIDLFFLLYSDEKSQPGIFQRIRKEVESKGFIKLFESLFFSLVSKTEYLLLRGSSKRIREHQKVYSIEEFNKNELITLNPILLYYDSGLFISFPDEDISRIKSLNLDIILGGNSSENYKGDILSSSKEGIISFRPGDYRRNMKGPAAFWEVFHRESSTGFVINKLSENSGSDRILFRGNIETQRTYTENIVNIYNAGNPYLARLILKYADENNRPLPEEHITSGNNVFTVPTIFQSLSYIWRTGLYLSIYKMNKALHKKQKWGVAFVKSDWRDAALKDGIKIVNPPGHFLADPFVITRNGRTICYVEDYSNLQGRACISAIDITNGTDYKILGPVIEEPFHMSYPYLLEYGNELYMIPETSGAKSIRLYKCVEFPLKWEYKQDILSDINTVDSMIFEYSERWWLLTNIATKGDMTFNSKLMAFYSDNPLSGEWTPHEKNPLVFDSDKARNGGILDVNSPFPVRSRQKQSFDFYGASLTLAQINELTPSSFEEQEIKKILPDFSPKIKGCHHIHSNGIYTVFDYFRLEKLS